ncbi:MAG TPA: UDP-N-acetylglucosamine 2-epimerase [Chitinophagaceae bacterium]|nr:UDP-N-acetylglucosamine 2-epimerase [Chitinophagaceae bacterium]
MGDKRKVCVVITARPSYSRIKTAMQAIKEHPGLELQIVLAGSALLDRYGSIEYTVENDGFEVNEKVYMVLEGENPMAMAKTTGIGLLELSNTLYNLKPDIVLVIADRFETISVSIAAAYQNIPLVHVQGGEITGNIDEKVRHANTKLADIHFVASESARERVIRLGEDPGYVFNTGCPSIDLAADTLKDSSLSFNPYKKYGGVGETPSLEDGYIVVMQHPVTTEYEESRSQIFETLEAARELDIPALWFWPNVDAGADGISRGIRAYREKGHIPKIHFFKNMVPEDFLKLLYNAKCLVGNSSVGIRECSFLGVPVVNIGSRQNGRDRGPNVKDVTYSKKAIGDAIKYWLGAERPKGSDVYGGGDAGKKMAGIMATVPLRYHKRINF